MRRPVRSNNITNRKLFNNGGFPTMGAQAQMPNPLNVNMGGTLPQANNIMAPSGILASSTELSNAVGDQALAQSFAPTANMNSGGIASFAHGGTHNATSFPGQVGQDYLTDLLKQMNIGIGDSAKRFKETIIDKGRSFIPPILGGKAYEEPGLSDEVIQSTVNATVYGEPFGVSRDFNWEPFDATTNTRTIRGAFKIPVITGDIGYQGVGLLGSQKMLGNTRFAPPPTEMNAKEWFRETATQTANRIFPGENVSEIPSVEGMIDYMKMGQQPYAATIDELSKSILTENPDINPMDFREQLSVALKTMVESDNPGVQGIIAEAEQESAAAITQAEEIEANKLSVDDVQKSMDDVINYKEQPIDPSIVGTSIETDIDLALSRWKGQGYSSAFIETLREEGKNDEFISELVSRIDPDQAASEQETNFTTVYDETVGQKGEEGEDEVINSDGITSYNLKGKRKSDPNAVTGGEGFDTPGYNAAGLENIEAPQNQKNILASDAQQEVERLNKANKELATKQATEANVVKAASNAGDEIFVQQTRGDGQEAVNDTLDRFAKEFMDRMPKFKGKTENEKGWDLIMLGSAIMGGTSPNALENIGKGFLATGDRFTSDDKAKRAYENDIQLGAAKYSLSKLATQEARDAADKRNITMMVAGKDMKYDGVDYEKGSLIQVNLTKLLEGPLPDGLTTQGLYSAALKTVDDANTVFAQNVAAAAKLKNDTITKNTITRTEETALLAKNSKLTKSYKSSVTGRLYLNRAIDILNYNPDAISGGKSVVKEAYERFKNALNFGNKYEKTWGEEDKDGNAWGARDSETGEYLNATRQNYNMNVRIAFQNLIPVALAGVQSANSISNRDVQFLADAFIDSGAIDENGLFNENVWKNAKTIKAKLNATNDLFLRQEEGFLEDMQKEFDSLGGRYRPMVDESGDPGVARASSYVPENMPYLYNYQTGLPEEDDDGNLIPNPNYVGNYAATLREVNKKIRTTGYVKSADGKWRLK